MPSSRRFTALRLAPCALLVAACLSLRRATSRSATWPGAPRTSGRAPIRSRPAAKSGSATPTGGSRSRASTGRPSKSAPSGSPAPRPNRRARTAAAHRDQGRRSRPSVYRCETEAHERHHDRCPLRGALSRPGRRGTLRSTCTNTNGDGRHHRRQRQGPARTTNGERHGKGSDRRRRRADHQRQREHRSRVRGSGTRLAAHDQRRRHADGCPKTAKADIVATCTNGGINVSTVKIDVAERRAGDSRDGSTAAAPRLSSRRPTAASASAADRTWRDEIRRS